MKVWALMLTLIICCTGSGMPCAFADSDNDQVQAVSPAKGESETDVQRPDKATEQSSDKGDESKKKEKEKKHIRKRSKKKSQTN